MGTIASDKNVIKLFYNSKAINDNEAKVYFSSSDKKILAIDTAKEEITPTQWSQLLEGLAKEPLDLIDKNHASLKKMDVILDGSFSMEDWLKIITNNPEIIIGVIALIGEKYLYFKTPKAIIEFIANDADSAYDKRN